MAKKVIKKVASKKSKPVEKKAKDKKEVVEITLGDNVQHVRIYPKYNPLRK